MQHLFFPGGLCAFETFTRFRLLQSSHYEELWFLESEQNPELSFPLTPVRLLDANYRLTLSDEDSAALGAADESGPGQLLCFAIVTASQDSPPTANLLAPVVVNQTTGVAVQAVRADGFLESTHSYVKIGIRAPKEVLVLHKELFLTAQQNRAALRRIPEEELGPLLRART